MNKPKLMKLWLRIDMELENWRRLICSNLWVMQKLILKNAADEKCREGNAKDGKRKRFADA